MTRDWSTEVESLRDRLGGLINRSAIGDPSREVASEALEELAVAIEELQTQNNELLASQTDVTLERQRFSDLFDNVPDGYLLTTAEGIITEANATVCELLGAPRSTLVGRPLVRHIAPDDRRSFYSLLHRVGRASVGEMLTIDLTIQDHDLIPATLRATVGPDPTDRSTVRWLIHDQRQELLVEGLRASEERLRRLFEAADVGIVLCDAVGDLVYLNREAAELLGIEQDPESSTDWLRNVPPDHRADVDAKLRAAAAGERSASIRHQVVRVVDDEPVPCWVDHGVVPFRTRAGQSNGFLSTLTDATQEQNALADLRRSTEFSNAILDTAGMIVVVADPSGRIQLFNRMAESVSGWSQEEATGRSVADLLIAREDRDDVAELMRRVSRGEVVRSENDLVTKSGRRRRISWTTTALRSASGAIEAVVGTGLDVTEQRLMERQIAQTERLHSMGRLASGIAHDFNNTLAVILARIDRIDRRTDDPQTITDIDALRRSIENSRTMIGDLLTLSGRHPQAPATANLNVELERGAALLADLLGSNVSIELDLPVIDTFVAIGPDRLDQIFTNLIINARDAMPDGGIVSIEAVAGHVDSFESDVANRVAIGPGPYVRISVADTGTGIEPETITHVFEPYFTTKEHGKGTGLGLAMVYGIVQQSGGAIIAESEPGEGTTVTLWLPSIDAPEAQDERTRGVRIEPPRHRDPVEPAQSVLVVEDDDEIRDLLIEQLDSAGFAVIGADRGDSAMTLLETQVDLLITDIDLPGATGFEVAAQWSDRWPRLSVLFISGVASAEAVQQIPLGAAFLAKPFSRAELLRSIRGLLTGDSRTSS